MDRHLTWRRWGVSLLGVTLAAALAACGAPAEGNDDSTLRFAVTDLQGLEELQREFGAFQKTFEEKSGLDLEFFAVTDRTIYVGKFYGPAQLWATTLPSAHHRSRSG